MFCAKCKNDLVDCTCEDLEERLESLRDSPFIHTPSIVDKPLAEIKKKRLEPKGNVGKYMKPPHPCCDNEDRDMNGWCKNCGDPCY